jgi:hypothetical protein
LQEAGPRPAAFAESYLQLVLDDPVGSFDREAAEAALGPAAQAHFKLHLAERWRAAKDEVYLARAAHAAQQEEARQQRQRTPIYDQSIEHEIGLPALRILYLHHLEARGDIDGALAVLREDLPDLIAFQEIANLLDRHGRAREVLATLEAALQAHPSNTRLQSELLRYTKRQARPEKAPPRRANSALDAALAQAPHSENQQTAQRVKRLKAQLTQAMRSAYSPYRNELQLVRDICELMPKSERFNWLADLRKTYKAKRSFVRELPKI